MTEDSKLKLLYFTNTCDSLRKTLLFGTTSLTPLNFEEEKTKFFASSTYNPVFYYKPFDPAKSEAVFKELDDHLHTLSIPRDLRLYLCDYIKNLRMLEKTKLSIGHDDFGYHAKRLFNFGDVNADSFLASLPTLSFSDDTTGKLFSAYEIAEIFEYALHHDYGLTHFTVHVDEQRRHIIWTGGTKVNIGSAVKRYEKNVHRLVVHEIESHALQSHNLSKFTNPFIRLTKYKDLNLYGEGLAVYNEIKTGTITKKAYDQYVYRLRAVSMLDKSFRQIYNYLCSYVPEKQAFLITYRVKRGMKHTSKPGGFPKDASYLLGYKAVLDYINAGLRPEFLYLSKTPFLTGMLLRQNLLHKEELIFPKFLHKKTTPVPTPTYVTPAPVLH